MTLHRYISAEQRFWARVEKTDRQYRAKIAVYNDYAAAIRQYEGS